jgi:transcriptional regulator with XRE-family HTH domain
MVTETEPEAFSGTKLRDMREAKGWTQAEAGRRAGVAQRTWSAYETGMSPSVRRLGMLAAVLGCQPGDLFEVPPTPVPGAGT